MTNSSNETIQVGIVGLGANTRQRHVPGLRACNNVEIIGVCNRTPKSTNRAAHEFEISRTYADWQELVADDDVDAVVIGTWPYLHCPIAVAALDAGKHVMTEARMAMNVAEARQMLAASQRHPQLAAQIVPSPLGLFGNQVVLNLLPELGELREVVLLGINAAYADPQAPLHWRQSAEYSGVNMLALGIMHETLMRWTPPTTRVLAQTDIFTRQRVDDASGQLKEVTTPDLVHVLTQFENGARGVYHLSSVALFGPPPQIHLYGTSGTLQYIFAPEERIYFARLGDENFREVKVPDELAGGWRVEEEFVNAIRGQEPVRLTDFATGLRYMEFTQGVADSAESGQAVVLEPPGV